MFLQFDWSYCNSFRILFCYMGAGQRNQHDRWQCHQLGIQPEVSIIEKYVTAGTSLLSACPHKIRNIQANSLILATVIVILTKQNSWKIFNSLSRLTGLIGRHNMINEVDIKIPFQEAKLSEYNRLSFHHIIILSIIPSGYN